MLVGGLGALIVVALPAPASLGLIALLCILVPLSSMSRVENMAAAMTVLAAFLMPMNRLGIVLVPISDIVMLLAIGLYLLTRLTTRTRPNWTPYRPVLIGLGLLTLGGLAGAVFEVPGAFMYKALGQPWRDISGWAQNIDNLAKFVLGSFIPIGLWVLVPAQRSLVRRIIGAFVAGCFASAVVALVLPFGQGGGRMVGLTVHPNQLGSLCLLGTGAALSLLLTQDRFAPWGYVVLPVLSLGLLGSGSRAALAGMLVLGAIIGPLTRSRAIIGVLLAGTAVVLLLFAAGLIKAEGQNAVGRALGSDPSAANSSAIRADLGERVLDRWLARPLTGQGFNYMRPSHNVYLGVLASAGLLGVIGFAVLISGILRRTWRRRADLMVACMAAGYFAYLVNAYFDNIFWWRWLWFTVGMVVATTATSSAEDDVGPPGRGQSLADGPRLGIGSTR